jgi:hypothetical protein
MPFMVKGLSKTMPLLNEYNENLKLHLQVQREQLKTQKAIQEYLFKLNKRLDDAKI